MLPALSSLSVLLLSVSGFAKPVPRAATNFNLPISRKHNAVDIAQYNAVQIDQARARFLRDQALHPALAPAPNAALSAPIKNAVVMYTASVGVGNPATQFELLVDTGSSNTWIGAQISHQHIPTQTTRVTPNIVTVKYGSGQFTGNEFDEQVTLSPDLVINNQGLGVARVSEGIQSVDGILGVGPTDLTIGTLTPDTTSTVPTVVDNLFSQGTIDSAILGVSFEPLSDGELTFGGTDPSKFTGEITYAPITTTSPASQFWGIDISVTYGETSILPMTAGIVDTGTTLVLLASDAFQAYQQATGATQDSTTGLLTIADPSTLQSLFFNTGGKTFELTANAQIWPRTQNAVIGGKADATYLVVSNIGTQSGSGLDFILGYTFLERFYSVYDTTNSRVGLATTPFTDATSN